MANQAHHRLALHGALTLTLLALLVGCGDTNDGADPSNAAPSCAITAPETGGEGPPGAPVYFEATVSDADAPADWLSVTWESDKDGAIGSSTPDTDGSVTFATSALSTDIHTISMRVSDEADGTCTDSVVYTVRVAPPANEPDTVTIGDATPRRVVRTRFVSDTWRDIEYDVDTGELWFIGERSHGLDHFTDDGNDLWWCYMNTTDVGSGLLEFLMTHDLAADARKAQALDEGWSTYGDESYSFLTFAPLAAQQTFVNLEAPDAPEDMHTTEAYTDDYVAVENEGLFVVLYRNAINGHVYLGLGGASLGTHPPGDGSPNRDNGVRTDVAYKTTVSLPEQARQDLLEQFALVEPLYDDSAKAYDYEHPSGL